MLLINLAYTSLVLAITAVCPVRSLSALVRDVVVMGNHCSLRISYQYPFDDTTLCSNPKRVRSSSARYATFLADDEAGRLGSSQIFLLERQVSTQLRRQNFKVARSLVDDMFNIMGQEMGAVDKDVRSKFSQSIDNAVQEFTAFSFAPPFSDNSHNIRVLLGYEVIHQQQTSKVLSPPFNETPARTLQSALRAMTTSNFINQNQEDLDFYIDGFVRVQTDYTYRVLKQLATGYGVRKTGATYCITEKEFNMVLNSFCNSKRMDLAEKVIMLQERLSRTAPLSRVTFSILLKGYGILGYTTHVEKVMKRAEAKRIIPDTIMMNSLIDAYINCNALDKAQVIFRAMKNASTDLERVPTKAYPRPNGRTYNIILKGLANKGDLTAALSLSAEMSNADMWDHVTTNTLVHAAIVASDFILAKQILAKYTVPVPFPTKKHPNVESYTELLDAYGKLGRLDDAKSVLETMRIRHVMPNVFTYACIVAGYGRTGETSQAMAMIKEMRIEGCFPTAVTYNGLISGLVQKLPMQAANDFDLRVDQALHVLRYMTEVRIRPNIITVSTLVEALGRCTPPRQVEAQTLVEELERNHIIPSNNERLLTALIHTYGRADNIKGALVLFRKIRKIDTIAVNAFIDACCRCGHESLAADVFDHYFRTKRNELALSPDVISFSIIMAAYLRQGTSMSIEKVRKLYTEMKEEFGVCADTGLIDSILKALIRQARSDSERRKFSSFAATVIADAAKLEWPDSQFERRKRATLGTFSNVGEIDRNTSEGELFGRKGWNRMDSGFRLWGEGIPPPFGDAKASSRSKGPVIDKFLEDHGWNDVDSGFRIL